MSDVARTQWCTSVRTIRAWWNCVAPAVQRHVGPRSVGVAVLLALAPLAVKKLLKIRVGRPVSADDFTFTSGPRLARRLGLLERWYAELVTPHNTCFTLSLTGRVPSVNEVTQILQVVASRHPMLCVGMDLANMSYTALANDTPFEVYTVDRQSPDTWKDVSEQEYHHIVPLHPRQRLFRVIIVANAGQGDKGDFELLVNLHHVIADGLSNVAFWREFLLVYRDMTHGKGVDDLLSQDNDQVLPPPVDCLIDVRPSLGRLIWEVFWPSVLKRPESFWEGPHHIPNHPPGQALTTKHCHLRLDATHTHRLLAVARANATTIHGSLMAALYIAVAETWHGGKMVGLKGMSSVSLRGYTEPGVSRDTIGVYLTGSGQVRSINGGRGALTFPQYWALARSIKQVLVNDMPGPVELLGLLAHVPGSWVKVVEDMCRDHPYKRLSSFELSNLGRTTLESEYGDWQVRDLWFGQQAHAEGQAAIVVSCVTTGGNICMTLSYCHPLLDHAAMQRLTACIYTTLTEMSHVDV